MKDGLKNYAEYLEKRLGEVEERLAAHDRQLALPRPPSPSRFGPGIHELDRTLIIPRQEGAGVSGGVRAIPGTRCFRAGDFGGEGVLRTVLCFAPNVTRALIETEGHDDPQTGFRWNGDGNHPDAAGKTYKPYLAPHVHDLGIDGSANLSNHPYGHDKDYQHRADAIRLRASGPRVERVKFDQIPGYCATYTIGHGGQAGVFGYYDEEIAVFADLVMHRVLGGLQINRIDAMLSNICGSSFRGNALELNGGGAKVTGGHLYGADRIALLTQQATISHVYWEAARVTVEVMPGAGGTTINGWKNVATSWHRHGLFRDGVQALALNHDVRAEDETHTDIAGFEITSNVANCKLEGRLSTRGTSHGVLWGGHRGYVELFGNIEGPSTYFETTQPVSSCTIELNMWASHPHETTALKLGLAEDQKVWNYHGNVFSVRTNANRPIIFPGGGMVNNLSESNQVWINGERISPRGAGR